MIKWIRAWNFIFSLLLLSISCQRPNHAMDIMNLADRLINTYPDSSLTLLETIHPEQLRNKNEKAKYALLRSMIYDKSMIDTTDFEVLQPAIDYYLTHGTLNEKLRTYYYQGRIYQNRKEYEKAMQTYIKAKDLCSQASDTLTMANLMVAQAVIQYSMYKFEEYIENNLESANLYKVLGKSEYEILNLLNALDGCFLTQNKLRADSIINVLKLSTFKNKDYEKIIEPYMLSYGINFKDSIMIRKHLKKYLCIDSLDSSSKLDVALAYSIIGDSKKSLEVFNSIYPVFTDADSLRYMAIKPDILEANKDYSGALAAYRKFSCVIDSIHKQTFQQDLLFTQERYKIEKHNLRKLRHKDLVIWTCGFSILLLVFLSLILSYRYRLKKKQYLIDRHEKIRLKLEQENLRKENENLCLLHRQTELEHEREILESENLKMRIKQLEEESQILKKILENRNTLSKPVEDAIRIRVEMLNKLLTSHITYNSSHENSYNQWRDNLIKNKEEFMTTTRFAFKATHPSFMRYLEEHGLSETELNFACLYAIGFRGKEIGTYTEYKRHYHISSDIRKKLGIDEHQTNLSIYLRNLKDTM